MDPSRMVHQAVKIMHGDRMSGDLLMDAPDYSWHGLKQFAANRDAWRKLVQTILKPYSGASALRLDHCRQILAVAKIGKVVL